MLYDFSKILQKHNKSGVQSTGYAVLRPFASMSRNNDVRLRAAQLKKYIVNQVFVGRGHDPALRSVTSLKLHIAAQSR